jgi:phenylacetate-coenzyme A ligase PaaK-like adenylate-forming protein
MSVNISRLLDSVDWLYQIDETNFEATAIAIFQYQYRHNDIYRAYVQALAIDPSQVRHLWQIPFLPISFFKSHTVLSNTTVQQCPLVFESSGTTGSVNSKHYIKRPEMYRASFRYTFEQCYGSPDSFVILGLLPSYLERKNSSLVYMTQELINESLHAESGFYLDERDTLANVLKNIGAHKKVLLLGVTFALLDFAEQFPMDLSNIIVMETGGMKGRREEWTRDQVHHYLKQQWQLSNIHSEYGMTELLSQAYAKREGHFTCPPFMRVLVRDENDPFDLRNHGAGCLNIIDLANIDSCSFIATDDIGKIGPDLSFQVLGRSDNSALRGCSLMVI